MNSTTWSADLLLLRHADFDMKAGSSASGTSTYELLVRGELTVDLAEDLGARSFEPCDGKTLVIVDVIDQAHLHGVLGWLQDHNIAIERVNPI